METTSLKTCRICNVEKPKTEYSTETKQGNKKHRVCKLCRSDLAKQRYHSNTKAKENIMRNCLERITANKARAVEYLGGKCEDCGGVYPQQVYDFHHRDPKEKDISPARARHLSWENYKKEIDKCVLLCANCHRIKHIKTTEEGCKGK